MSIRTRKINLRDPAQLKRLLKALAIQEHGRWAGRYDNGLYQNAATQAITGKSTPQDPATGVPRRARSMHPTMRVQGHPDAQRYPGRARGSALRATGTAAIRWSDLADRAALSPQPQVSSSSSRRPPRRPRARPRRPVMPVVVMGRSTVFFARSGRLREARRG